MLPCRRASGQLAPAPWVIALSASCTAQHPSLEDVPSWPNRQFEFPWAQQFSDILRLTIHQADQRHYTPGNASVAVLLATSVLRALQELAEEPPGDRDT